MEFRPDRSARIALCAAALALGGCTKPQQVFEIAIDCPHSTTFQAEVLAATFEVALAGMPGAYSLDSLCAPGHVRIYVVNQPGVDMRRQIIDRLGWVADGSVAGNEIGYATPVVREITKQPALTTGLPAQMVEILPDAQALAERGIAERDFWHALAEQFDAAETLDPPELLKQTLEINGSDFPLSELAKIRWTTQPAQVARSQGNRLPQTSAPAQRRP